MWWNGELLDHPVSHKFLDSLHQHSFELLHEQLLFGTLDNDEIYFANFILNVQIKFLFQCNVQLTLIICLIFWLNSLGKISYYYNYIDFVFDSLSSMVLQNHPCRNLLVQLHFQHRKCCFETYLELPFESNLWCLELPHRTCCSHWNYI